MNFISFLFQNCKCATAKGVLHEEKTEQMLAYVVLLKLTHFFTNSAFIKCSIFFTNSHCHIVYSKLQFTFYIVYICIAHICIIGNIMVECSVFCKNTI